MLKHLKINISIFFTSLFYNFFFNFYNKLFSENESVFKRFKHSFIYQTKGNETRNFIKFYTSHGLACDSTCILICVNFF